MHLNKTIIGALHFSPMIGYEGFEGYDAVLKKARADLKAFVDGGVDAVIFENNYDLPHKIKVSPETITMMTRLILELTNDEESKMSSSKIPFGISVLWNDYEAALTIAKITGAGFIRVPVFVDAVRTDFGEIHPTPKDVLRIREELRAENIKIYTDIHVKHASLLSKKNITEPAVLAIENKSDGLIITGKWTGEAPDISALKEVRAKVGDFPIIIGSGCDKNNIKELFRYADGAIVSTSLKEGDPKNASEERNIKSYDKRIIAEKVKDFVKAARI